MTKQLNAQTAIIKTAAIEIKALKISDKQVTFGVFRQLPVRELIDYSTLKMNGIPWGHVNYHPDKCADGAKHIHTVWQDEQTLYRTNIYATQYWPNPYRETTEKAMTLMAQSSVQFYFYDEYERFLAMTHPMAELQRMGFYLNSRDGLTRANGRNATEEEAAEVAHITQKIDIDFFSSFPESRFVPYNCRLADSLYKKHAKWFCDLFHDLRPNTRLKVSVGHGAWFPTDIDIQSIPEWLEKTLQFGSISENQYKEHFQCAKNALKLYIDWEQRAESLYQSLCNLDQLYIAT